MRICLMANPFIVAPAWQIRSALYAIRLMAWAHLDGAPFLEAVLEPRGVHHRDAPPASSIAFIPGDTRAEEVCARAIELVLAPAPKELDELDAKAALLGLQVVLRKTNLDGVEARERQSVRARREDRVA